MLLVLVGGWVVVLLPPPRAVVAVLCCSRCCGRRQQPLLWWLLGTRVRWLAIVVVLQVRVAYTGARGEPAVLCGGGSAGGEQVW